MNTTEQGKALQSSGKVKTMEELRMEDFATLADLMELYGVSPEDLLEPESED